MHCHPGTCERAVDEADKKPGLSGGNQNQMCSRTPHLDVCNCSVMRAGGFAAGWPLTWNAGSPAADSASRTRSYPSLSVLFSVINLFPSWERQEILWALLKYRKQRSTALKTPWNQNGQFLLFCHIAFYKWLIHAHHYCFMCLVILNQNNFPSLSRQRLLWWWGRGNLSITWDQPIANFCNASFYSTVLTVYLLYLESTD